VSRLNYEDIAGQTIENAFSRIADQQPLESTAGDRAHDNQRAVNLAGDFGNRIRRVTSDNV
jgi:hypothetical protein